MYGLLRCNINTGVHVRARSGRIPQRCHNSLRWETGATECGWCHAPEVRGGFRGFWKSQLVELRPASGEDGWLRLARRSQASGLCGGCHTYWGGRGRWKSQNRKNVYLSPYVEESLNSIVIKGFVPELRSRKCFSCFEILCSMLYIYEHYMSISHIHIGLWYNHICLNVCK